MKGFLHGVDTLLTFETGTDIDGPFDYASEIETIALTLHNLGFQSASRPRGNSDAAQQIQAKTGATGKDIQNLLPYPDKAGNTQLCPKCFNKLGIKPITFKAGRHKGEPGYMTVHLEGGFKDCPVKFWDKDKKEG